MPIGVLCNSQVLFPITETPPNVSHIYGMNNCHYQPIHTGMIMMLCKLSYLNFFQETYLMTLKKSLKMVAEIKF